MFLFWLLFRKQCIGAEKWRWTIRWTILRRRDQFEDIDSRILRCLVRRLPLWKRSSRTPRVESLPIPLKYIDMMLSDTLRQIWTYNKKTTSTSTVKYHRLDPGLDFNKILQFRRTAHPKEMCGQETGWRRSKLRPDWMKFGQKYFLKISQREARVQWDTGKTKLDAARRLSGIHYIESDVKEFDNVVIKSRRRLETHMESSMPCTAQKDAEKRTSIKSMSTSRRGLCAESQLEETSCTKEKKDSQFILTKLMHTNPEDAAAMKMANTSTKSILQTENTTLWVFTICFSCRYFFRRQCAFGKRRWQWTRNGTN